MIKILDNILLSENVKENFYLNYNNVEFYKWLNGFLPEVEKCRNLKQDNPWHIYNCLDHILVSVEEINKQTKDLKEDERRMLAYTMFFHDIGKPDCCLRRYSKLYGREVDSFFNHNKASVKIANNALEHLNFSKQDKNKILCLIDFHDVFMFITLKNNNNPHHHLLTEEYVMNLINDLNSFGDGKELIEYLLMVGRADNKAQNPEMTKESLSKIDIIKEMVETINSKE